MDLIGMNTPEFRFRHTFILSRTFLRGDIIRGGKHIGRLQSAVKSIGAEPLRRRSLCFRTMRHIIWILLLRKTPSMRTN